MAATPPSTAPKGRSVWRSQPVRLLLVVDAALLVLLLVIALVTSRSGPAAPAASSGPGAGTAAGASPAPTPGGGTRSAPSTPGGSPSPTANPGQFVTPSGNIACLLTASAATCAIHSPTFTEPALAGCAQAGRAVVLDSTGVQLVCPDTLKADPFAGAPARLAYGSTTTVGGYTCTSATNGVTCVDGSGAGFRLARGSLTMLP